MVQAPVNDVVARAAEDAAEQRDVGAEREHVERDRDDDPVPDRVVELADRVVETDQLREHDVDPEHQQHDDGHAAEQLAAVRQQRLERADGLVVAGFLPVLEILLEIELLVAQVTALGAKTALLGPHQPARGSSR